MPRIIRLLVAALVLSAAPVLSVAQQPAPQKHVDTKAQTVYITRTGRRYHRKRCQYLRSSKIPISLKDAKGRGFTPCPVCRPPQ
jgi:competence protein ComEC